MSERRGHPGTVLQHRYHHAHPPPALAPRRHPHHRRHRQPYYLHTLEGDDDMPAHAKSSLTGISLTIPISRHTLNLGTWQGIYLCEYRDHATTRRLVLTVYS
ncbi:MAG: YjbQ family protein [Muribaculaceae bacterium]|nr:YjbQ family protein [Muribaculaceae bacterium]